MRIKVCLGVLALFLCVSPAFATYTNFESHQVHPVALTPDGTTLLVINTPTARLEVFELGAEGTPEPTVSIPVGLEPVSVIARSNTEAWVVNHLSDSISIVDLNLGSVTETLFPGDEPTDVAFAAGKAFVTVSQEDRVKVYDLANLSAAPTVLDIFGEDPRALAVSPDGQTVYAVVLHSGNQTTVLSAGVTHRGISGLDVFRLAQLGINDTSCDGAPNPYPPLPAGIVRNPALIDPVDGLPKVGLIVKWNRQTQAWEDDAGQNWSHCLPFRMPDQDLFAINASTLAVTPVSHVGTTLFDVSVNPANGRVYVANTDARNHVRFEHPLGVEGHVVDNRLTVIDPQNGNAVTPIDLNAHVDRESDPSTNLAEREASISQPHMMAWRSDGSEAFLTAIGSRKVFKVDGACLSPACIFGAARANPDAVEVGNGPVGVVLSETHDRLYVFNRIDNSLVTVDATAMQKLGEIQLNDPAGEVVRQGRIFLYDGILTSGHGDASCASCHVSADMDRLGWDLGNPEGDLLPYGTPGDNVRFVQQVGPDAVTCDPETCADHEGFDPQKGPMTTQTFRAMIEPLHWRGDRGTFNDFNGAFPALMGTASGLSAEDMETMRQFALGIKFPPNPYRNLDDTLPNVDVSIPGHIAGAGNPTTGRTIYTTGQTDGLSNCNTCHELPFGTKGGKLGGIEPGDPADPDHAALLAGNRVLSEHSDMKVPHLRNMYEKFGPVFGTSAAPIDTKAGFGFNHDGSIPDLGSFFSAPPFQVSAQDIRDFTSFVVHFPTGTPPAVGQQVTVPAGTPPTGSTEEEQVLSTLLLLGDQANPDRHCDLVAHALDGGLMRSYSLSGGLWNPDGSGNTPQNTNALRTSAGGPLTFLCAPTNAGSFLGGDRDGDGVLDAEDCAPATGTATGPPPQVLDVRVDKQLGAALVDWNPLIEEAGSYASYEVFSGGLDGLQAVGFDGASCLEGNVYNARYVDARPDPAPGQAYYYLVRARNECTGSLGLGREALADDTCPNTIGGTEPSSDGPAPAGPVSGQKPPAKRLGGLRR
ncbi:hypothetical protein ABI59_11945 [Acidobacteria bacterium Mor1]|nr:hypothetical protein ABI59_11945 [Acidobacteria bacterium Mor1]